MTRAQLMMVIRQRVEELTNEIEAALKGLGFTGPVGRQVVLTGGGAELKNIADYMQGVLGRAVRVGRPKQITGLPDAHSGPASQRSSAWRLLAASGQGDIRDIARHRSPSREAEGYDRSPVAAMKGGYLAATATAGGEPWRLCIARRDARPTLVFLLGAAIFLNYVDRGALPHRRAVAEGRLASC